MSYRVCQSAIGIDILNIYENALLGCRKSPLTPNI